MCDQAKEVILKIKLRFIIILITVSMLTACATLFSPSHKTIGRDYIKRGNYNAAIQELKFAAEENTSAEYTIESLSLLGEAYEKNGDFNYAILAYNKALDTIRTRMESNYAENKNATLSAIAFESPKGTSNQLITINKLVMEELDLKRKYQKILFKIENIQR